MIYNLPTNWHDLTNNRVYNNVLNSNDPETWERIFKTDYAENIVLYEKFLKKINSRNITLNQLNLLTSNKIALEEKIAETEEILFRMLGQPIPPLLANNPTIAEQVASMFIGQGFVNIRPGNNMQILPDVIRK